MIVGCDKTVFTENGHHSFLFLPSILTSLSDLSGLLESAFEMDVFETGVDMASVTFIVSFHVSSVVLKGFLIDNLGSIVLLNRVVIVALCVISKGLVENDT